MSVRRQEPPVAPSSSREPTGGGLSVIALAALIGAVLWFGLTPVPPAARPREATPAAAADSAAAAPAGGATGGQAGAATVAPPVAEPADPLPSWNEGPTKRAILAFVEQVSRPGSETFVPVAERVAVFDHDGTLVCEKPIVHGMYFIDRLRALVERQPEIGHEEPYATLLTGDIDTVRRLGKKYLLDLMFTALAGVPEEELEADVRRFLAAARHPVFDVPYGEVTYQPMKEVIALLRSHAFSVWICTGSGVHFMRPAAEAWYGIGPEHVIASRSDSELREVALDDEDVGVGPGAANRRLQLVGKPHLLIVNDEERKPVTIGEHVGRRPIFAAGNVGSTGDIEMLRWCQSSRRPSLQLLVLHDDAEREMAYGEPSNDSLEAAERYGWNVVRMATDWNRVFARDLGKKHHANKPPEEQDGRRQAPGDTPTGTGPAEEKTAPAGRGAPAAAGGRWEEEIAAFEKADRERPPAPGGVVFLGSSNIRMWNTLAEDFPGMQPLNRGVGGARLAELAAVAARLVAAAKPAVVVVSAGTNDVAAGATAAEVRDAFAALVASLRQAVPEAEIVFLAIAPSIERWGQRDRQEAANAAVRDYIAAQPAADASRLTFLDTSAAFFDAEGQPAAECFLDDRQHPSTIGNARRAGIIRPVLRQLLD